MTGKRVRKDGVKGDRAQDARPAGGNQAGELAEDAPALVLHDNAGLQALRDVPIPLTSRAIFWQPRHFADSPTLVHLPFLFWLVETARPDRVVQLGLGDGVGFMGLCQAIDKLGLESGCMGLDLQRDGDGALSPDLTETREALYGDFSFVVKEDPARATRHVQGGQVDMLLIDVPLDEALLASLRANWVPLLSDRAILVLHHPDANLPTPEAVQYLDELRRARPAIRFPQAASGLEVVLLGQRQPERLRRFAGLELGTPGYLAARQVFSRLGHGLAKEQEARSRQAALSGRTAALEDAQARIAALEGEIGPLRTEMEAAQEAERDQARLAATAQARVFDLMLELERARQTTEDAVEDLLADRNALLASISDAVVWEPAHREAGPMLEHAHFLYWLARVSNPARCVALGVGAGSGYFALCAGVLENGSEASLLGIDDWSADGAGGPASDMHEGVPATLRDHNARHYAPFSRLVGASPDQVADFRDDGPVDLLVLCRELDEQRLTAVIDAWLPAMSERGIIVVPGARNPALSEMRQDRPHLELTHGAGLLVLLVGQAPPGPVAFAAGLAPETPERVVLESAFRALGLGLAHRVQAETASAASARLDAEMRALRSETAAQVARRDTALAEKAQELETAGKLRRDLEAQVARQREELRLLTARAEELTKELALQADEVGAMRNSTSWRLTSPIRKLKSPLGSLRGRFGNGASSAPADRLPAVEQQAEVLRQSPLFDSEWYAARYPECGGPEKAAEHYVTEGAFTGNDPGPDFETVAYYDNNPDVAGSGWPALSHYLFHGKAEGRSFRAKS